MICMDPIITTKIIESLIDKFDDDVHSWAAEIAKVCKTVIKFIYVEMF